MSKEKQDLWQEYNFFDVIEVLDFRGRTPKKLNLDWGGDIPALSANNVKMGKIDYSLTTNFGSEELYSKWMTKGDLEIGDLVLTTEAPAGNVVVINDNKKYILSQRVIGLKPDKRVIDSNYLMYFFMSNYFKNYLQGYGTGTTVTGISQKNLEFLKIIAPPLEEQQKIAEILSSVDATIEKTEQVIAKTEEVKKGLMQQLLTKGIGHTEFKQTEIGEIPVEWEIKNLVEVAVLTMGQSPSSEDCNEDGQGLVFFQGCSEFGDKYPIPKKYCTNPRKRASKGDILISVRAPVGDLNIAHIECAIGRGLAAIDPINIDRDYLFYYFKLYKDQWQRIQQGSTFSAINKNDLESLLVPCPPKDEQMLIVSKLLTLDKKLEIETEQLDSLQILKKGLMQQLLTGQVRVKVD